MNLEDQKKRMIDDHLIARGIRDEKVIEAFRAVPRESFIPAPYESAAYADNPLPIGEGQTISQPYMVGLMTQELGMTGSERVLEVGTGSGYQAAILAETAKEVFTVERDPVLSERAGKVLDELGYKNISFKVGDGTLGWEEKAPYDGIMVTAGAPEVPEALKAQLADGGRLVIPVGPLYGQTLMNITRDGDSFDIRKVCGCVFVPLIGQDGWSTREY